MRLLSLIGFGAFVTASLAVGLRLLLLSRRTRQVPELAIGLALFAGGGVGYLLVMLVLGVHAIAGAAAGITLFAGSSCMALGTLCLAIGVRRIFRPGDRVAAACVAGLAIALVATLVGRLFDLRPVPARSWIFWTATLASLVTYAWSAAESLHYWGQMRRRVRIGLADASTAQRFLLWGVSASAAVGMHVASGVTRVIVGAAPPPTALMAITAALGLVAATGLWLAFFPRRAAVASGASAR